MTKINCDPMLNRSNDPMLNKPNDPMLNLHGKDAKTLTKKRSTSALWAFLGFLGFILLLWLGVSLLSSLLHDPVASDTATTSSNVATDVNSVDTTSSTEPVNKAITTDTTSTDNQTVNQNSAVPLVEVKPAPSASVDIVDPNATPAPVNADSTTTTDTTVTNTATPSDTSTTN